MRKIWLCILLVLGCFGCQAKHKVSKDEFELVVHVQTDDSIGYLVYECYLGQQEILTSDYQADDQKQIDRFVITFHRKDFPENSDLRKVSMNVYAYASKEEYDQAHQDEHMVNGEVVFNPIYANQYAMSIHGSKQQSYWATFDGKVNP